MVTTVIQLYERTKNIYSSGTPARLWVSRLVLEPVWYSWVFNTRGICTTICTMVLQLLSFRNTHHTTDIFCWSWLSVVQRYWLGNMELAEILLIYELRIPLRNQNQCITAWWFNKSGWHNTEMVLRKSRGSRIRPALELGCRAPDVPHSVQRVCRLQSVYQFRSLSLVSTHPIKSHIIHIIVGPSCEDSVIEWCFTHLDAGGWSSFSTRYGVSVMFYHQQDLILFQNSDLYVWCLLKGCLLCPPVLPNWINPLASLGIHILDIIWICYRSSRVDSDPFWC